MFLAIRLLSCNIGNTLLGTSLFERNAHQHCAKNKSRPSEKALTKEYATKIYPFKTPPPTPSSTRGTDNDRISRDKDGGCSPEGDGLVHGPGIGNDREQANTPYIICTLFPQSPSPLFPGFLFNTVLRDTFQNLLDKFLIVCPNLNMNIHVGGGRSAGDLWR